MPAPGWVPGPHKVKIGDILAAIVGTKPGRLKQRWLQGEGTAFVAVEGVAEVYGVNVVLGDVCYFRLGR